MVKSVGFGWFRLRKKLDQASYTMRRHAISLPGGARRASAA